MGTTVTLVEASPTHLRYRIDFTGGGGSTFSITSTGAATPDLLTDSSQGPLKKLAKVISDGYGTFAAGAQTQAKARALWCSDYIGAQPAIAGNNLLPTARMKLSPVSGTDSIGWTVDADVSAGNPVINGQKTTALGTASVIMLDITVPEAKSFA
jgi:hypothetical protein